MFEFRDYPIHNVNEHCILPTKKRFNHNINNNSTNLYGNTSHYRERFNDLGVPIFVVQIKSSSDDDSVAHHGQDGVISDELFDELFGRVEKKSKATKRKTLKKRKEKKENGN